MKVCSKCKEKKELGDFYNNKSQKDGKSNYCKKCHSEEGKKRKYNYHYDRREYSKKWYQKNKEKLKPIRKKWKDENKERQSELSRNWYLKNKEKKLKSNYEREKERMLDPLFRIKKNLRIRVYDAIRGRTKKSYKTMQLLGCSIAEFKKYLEDKFEDGMTWDNYGTYWHIDHIKPCSLFNLLDKKEQMTCFHYTNMQPMKAKDNLKKYNKFKMKKNE